MLGRILLDMSAWWDEQLTGNAWPQLPAARGLCDPVLAGPRLDAQPRLSPPAADEWSRWWQYSRSCARTLRAGQLPPTVEVYGPVLEPGEAALLTAEVGYRRCCGSDARYSPLPMVVAGRPAVMFGALAVQGVINHRRKVAAERNAAVQWRFHQTANVIVTTDRLLCSTVPHGQVSFWYGACSEFYPDLQNWTLTLGFDSTYPVRLSGPTTPALSLWSAYGVLGDAWSQDPRLAALLA